MKTIIFLECNASGTGVEAIRLAKERGYQSLLLTKEKDFYNSLPDNPVPLVDDLIELNTDCVASTLNAIEGLEAAGVLAFDDYRLITAAVVSKQLGLPAPEVEGLLNCRFKQRARMALKDLPGNVDFQPLPLDVLPEESQLKFPCVIKPCDESGSVGVRICEDFNDVRQAVTQLQRSRTNKRGYRLSGQYLIESFAEGPEFSAELFWSKEKKRWELLGLTRKSVTEGRFSVERGHDFPWRIADEETIKRRINQWLNAVGLKGAVAHVEFKLTDEGPVLIEINPRIGGDMIHRLCELTTGVNLIEMYLSLWVKDFETAPPKAQAFGGASIRFLLPPKAGKVTHIIQKEDNNQILTEKSLSPLPMTFQGISSSFDRLGYFILGGDTAKSSSERAEASLKNFEIIME